MSKKLLRRERAGRYAAREAGGAGTMQLPRSVLRVILANAYEAGWIARARVELQHLRIEVSKKLSTRR